MPRIGITSRESGFTLVELLIYMLMFIVVSGSLYSILITNTKSYSSQENKVEMTQDLRAAMGLMVTEIRMAGCDPTDRNDVGFVNDADDRYDTDANSVHFTMDIDASGEIIPNSEDISYYLDTVNDQIKRRTGDGSEPPIVAENITGLTFNYRFEDGDTGIPGAVGDGTDDLEDIRSVQITIQSETANVDAVTGARKTQTQMTWVRVRNAGT